MLRSLLALLLMPMEIFAAEPTRPNILWLIAEDFGNHLGCCGTKEVSTPILDKLAAEGIRYSRFYTVAPVCSPSRSAFMTGMYQTTIGAHNHRSHRDDGYKLPDGVKLLTERMHDAGYLTANVRLFPKSIDFKGTAKTDWNFTSPAKPFDTDRWEDLKQSKPFFAQVNFQETHRTFHAPKHADPAKVEVPPYEPDHPITRADRAAYLDATTELDRKIGQVLKQLETDGLADSTIVVFFGDNGQAHIRGKQFCYEEGLNVPLIVRYPKAMKAPFKPGTVSNDLVMSIDLAPTMLALAGDTKPTTMQGQDFLMHPAKPRQYTFGARDRCDETVFRLRTVCDERFRYIRNFTPNVPFLQANAYKEKQYPVWTLLPKLKAEGKLTPVQAKLCAATMPEEELYDLKSDPHQIDNLIGKTEHRETHQRLRGVLEKWIDESNDQGRMPESPDVIRNKGTTKPATPPNKGMTVSANPMVAASAKPNVLFIAVDDLNHWVGHLGRNPQAKTPNLDRLAKMGVTFTRANCAAPVCNPSRAALMTGKRPGTSGVYDNGQIWTPHTPVADTLTSQFLKAGYDVYGSGKIYHANVHRTGEWSDYFVGGKEKSTPHPTAKNDGVGGIKFQPLTDNSKLQDESIVDYGIKHLGMKHEKPFFLAVGLHKPHMPWNVPKKYYDLFPLDKIELPPHTENDLADVPAGGLKFAKPKGDHSAMLASGRWKEAVQGYLAAIAYCDAQIGRLLDAYERSPDKANTILCLWGDHGWHLGEKEHWRKFALWEESARMPFIWVVPGVTTPGSVCERTVDLMCVYPTLCDLAKLPRPGHVEGEVITPLLKDAKAAWESPGITTYHLNNHSIRTEKWRYIRYADGGEELYDHDADPYEWKNLANDAKHAVVKEAMKKWLPAKNAPELPTSKEAKD